MYMNEETRWIRRFIPASRASTETLKDKLHNKAQEVDYYRNRAMRIREKLDSLREEKKEVEEQYLDLQTTHEELLENHHQVLLRLDGALGLVSSLQQDIAEQDEQYHRLVLEVTDLYHKKGKDNG